MSTVDIGRMDTVLTFVSYETERLTGGGVKNVRGDSFDLWASVEAIKSTSLLLEGKQVLNNAYRIKCRHDPAEPAQITLKTVIEWEGRVLVIKSCDVRKPTGTRGRHWFWDIIANQDTMNGS